MYFYGINNFKTLNMRKFTLLAFILLVCLLSNQVFSQVCNPGYYAAPGIYPDSTIGLPKAYVNFPYSTVITVVVPTDTFMYTTLLIDSIGISAVAGLPTGITWSTNPTNGYITGGESGCVLITGTPTIAQIGSYPIDITLQNYINSIPTAFPETRLAYYSLVISETIVSVEAVTNELTTVFNFPNPFTKETAIYFSSLTEDLVTMSIYNNIGQIVYKEQFNIISGKNTHQLKLSLEDGIYFYTIEGKSNSFHNKLIVRN